MTDEVDASQQEGSISEVLQLFLDADNVVIGSARSNVEQPGYVTVSPEIYADASARMGRVKYENGALVSYDPPAQPMPVVIAKIELYKRMTDDEFGQMKAGVATQSERIQEVFRMADNFREDDQLWPLLVQMGNQLYGEARCKQLLAQVYEPTEGAAS